MTEALSKTAIDHIVRPRNLGRLSGADGFGRVTGPCGDTMEIWLMVRDNRVCEATFMTDGCATTLASGSMVTELATGRPVAEAMKIDQDEILRCLEGLPPDSQHCALLAANTLREAIRDYLAVSREPWRKAYRTY